MRPRQLFSLRPPRLARRAIIEALIGVGLAIGGIAAASCSQAEVTPGSESVLDGAVPRRDGGTVEAPDGATDAGSPPPPIASCEKYCELVMTSCTGDQAQYASADECASFCNDLPLGTAGDTNTGTIACRQFYAGSPAATDPTKYCLAAGPYGGGVCGDRCTGFCTIVVAACSPDSAMIDAPYGSYPDCATACVDYTYRDAGADGGGESLDGPTSGDTLNCRLHLLRSVIDQNAGCGELAPDSGACH